MQVCIQCLWVFEIFIRKGVGSIMDPLGSKKVVGVRISRPIVLGKAEMQVCRNNLWLFEICVR